MKKAAPPLTGDWLQLNLWGNAVEIIRGWQIHIVVGRLMPTVFPFVDASDWSFEEPVLYKEYWPNDVSPKQWHKPFRLKVFLEPMHALPKAVEHGARTTPRGKSGKNKVPS